MAPQPSSLHYGAAVHQVQQKLNFSHSPPLGASDDEDEQIDSFINNPMRNTVLAHHFIDDEMNSSNHTATNTLVNNNQYNEQSTTINNPLLDESWTKDSELDPREIYMNHCSRIGIDPTFEFIFALNDKNIKSCLLSNRKKRLTDKDVICITTALTTNKHILELDLSDNHLTSSICSNLGDMLKRNTVLQVFKCGNNKLGDEGSSLIFQSIGSNPFSLINTLDLRGNKISNPSTISQLSSIFTSNRIVSLNLSHNFIDEEGAKIIAFELMLSSNHSSLKVLNLQHNKIGDRGASSIGKMLSSSNSNSLQELDLSFNRISVEGASALVTGLKSNQSLIKLNLRSNIMGDPGAYMFSKCLSSSVNSNLKELYLGFNGFTIDGAIALSNMLKTNHTLLTLDIQGILLDLNSMKKLSESLRENHSLLKLYLDIDYNSNSNQSSSSSGGINGDSNSNKLAPQVARIVSEALQSNNTLQDLIIGGDVDGIEESVNPRMNNMMDHETTNTTMNESLLLSTADSSLQSTPRRHFSRDGKSKDGISQFIGGSNGNVNHSNNTSYKGLFDDVLHDEEESVVSEDEDTAEEHQVSIQQQQQQPQPTTTRQHLSTTNENINNKRPSSTVVADSSSKVLLVTPEFNGSSIEERFDKLERLVFQIQQEHQEQINNLSNQIANEVNQVKQYASKLINSSLKNYHENFDNILEQYNVNNTPMMRSISGGMNSLLNNSNTVNSSGMMMLRESSSHLEQLKAELEMKVASSVREVEERIQGRLTDVDYRFNQSIATLHKCVDEKLERQQKVIGRMTEEQRWIEEEGIKLRVEHEAKVELMIKNIKSDLELMVMESKEGVNQVKQSIGHKYQGMERKVEDLQKRFNFEEENRQLLNALTRSTQHLPKESITTSMNNVSNNNSNNNRKGGQSLSPSSNASSKGSKHRSSPNSNNTVQDNPVVIDNSTTSNHYNNMIQALLSKSKEVLERNQQELSSSQSSSTTSSPPPHRSNHHHHGHGHGGYRSSTPAEREY